MCVSKVCKSFIKPGQSPGFTYIILHNITFKIIKVIQR